MVTSLASFFPKIIQVSFFLNLNALNNTIILGNVFLFKFENQILEKLNKFVNIVTTDKFSE